MALEMILLGIDAQWLVDLPINAFIDLYEKHIESLSMNMQMPLMGNVGTVKDDLYENKQWKDGNKQITRINILESAKASEGLRSSRKK